MSKQEIQRLRATMDDTSVMKHMASIDPDFNTIIERANAAFPSVTEVEQAKMPTYLINRHYFGSFYPGRNPPPDSTSRQFSATINGEKELAERGKMRNRNLLDPVPIEDGGVEDFGKNVLKSGGRLARDIGEAVRHPIQTGSALFQAGVGGLANLAEVAADNEELFNDPFGAETVASSIGDFYKERYGTLEGAKKTAFEDPVGFAADLAGFLGGAGAALRVAGGGAKASAIGRASTVATRAASLADPIAATARVATSPFKLLNKSVKALNNANLKSSFNLTRGQMQRLNRVGKDPAKFLADNKIVSGSADEIVTSLGNVAEESYNNVNRELSSIQETFAKGNVADLDRVLDRLSKDFSVEGLGDDLARVSKLVEKDALTLAEFNEAKRLIDIADKVFSKSGEVKAGFSAKGTANIRSDLKGFIESEAANRGVTNIAELNKTTQMAQSMLKEIGSASDKFGDAGRFLSFRDVAYGIGGSTIGGPVGAFLTIAAERIAARPAVATRLNLALNSLSAPEFKALEKAIKTGKETAESRVIMQSLLQAIESAPVQEDIRSQQLR